MKIKNKLIVSFVIAVIALVSGSGIAKAETYPTVITVSSTSTTEYSSVLTGNVTLVGTGSIVKRGFQIKPITSSVFLDSTCETGSFLTGSYTLSTNGSCAGVPAPVLSCNTTYNYRAIAYNAVGSSTGSTQSFRTSLCPTVPVIAANTTAVASTTSVVLSASITSTGGVSYPVTTRGFEYGTTTMYGQTVSENGSFGAGFYTLTATGLTCGTLYHYHPYAVNGIGPNTTAPDKTFTTSACPSPSPSPTPVSVPSLAGPTASSITVNSATLNGNITSTNNGTVTVRGFEYGTTISYGNYITESGSFSTGAYTGSASSLTCGTVYHFRSYAKNSAGTASSSDQTLTTSACPTPITSPTIDSLGSSSITATTSTISANVASTNGENLSARGFNWGLTNTYGQNVNQTVGN